MDNNKKYPNLWEWFWANISHANISEKEYTEEFDKLVKIVEKEQRGW